MVDHFALLNFSRTPWLDPAEVQTRFLELSAAAHPDRVHNVGVTEVAIANASFAELNKAATVLRDPKERLQHLLTLEGAPPATMSQNIPSGFFEISGEIGFLCKQVDALLESHRKNESPMIRVQLFEQSLQHTERVQEMQAKITSVKGASEAELQKIASSWPHEMPLDRLRELAHVFAMIGKWEAQLQERFAALAGLA